MKRCVITGAASGIGAALVQVFSEQGYEVIGIDRNEANSSQLSSFIKADLSSPEGLESLISELSSTPIDLFIHSAGINSTGAFEKANMSVQRRVLDVNLRAPMQLTKSLLANGTLRRGSSLIFIASLSHFVSYPGAAAYAASKDGLTAYARNLSVALKPQGIHVMTVFPGPTRTPHAREHSPDNSREAKRMPPDVLAKKVAIALKQKRYRFIPGLSNKLFALIGSYFPTLVERIMLKTLFAKLEDNGT